MAENLDKYAAPPPTYCDCGHIRIKHARGKQCRAPYCFCLSFKKAPMQPKHRPNTGLRR